MRKLVFAIFCLGAGLLCACGGNAASPPVAAGPSPLPPTTRIAAGVTVGGCPVGDMTLAQARDTLARHVEGLAPELTVTAGDHTTLLTTDLLRPSWSLDAPLQQAATAPGDTAITLPATYNPELAAIETALSQLAAKVDAPPVPAAPQTFDPAKQGDDRFVFSQGSPGRKLDVAATVLALREALASQKTDPLAAVVTTLDPPVTADALRAATTLRAGFSTSLVDNDARDVNIALCSEALSGSIIPPGAVFSINQTTGPRTQEKGYVESSTIVSGRIIPSTGGGICQVAGTLYNAALLADMPIVERTNHSLISVYLAPSLDATLVYGSKDLVIKNPTDMPMYVEAIVDDANRKLTFNLYGLPLPADRNIRIQSVVLEELPAPEGYDIIVDEDLSEGATEVWVKARTGIKSQAYKIVTNAAGDEVERTLISTDTYPPTKLTYRVGPATRVGPQ